MKYHVVARETSIVTREIEADGETSIREVYKKLKHFDSPEISMDKLSICPIVLYIREIK